MVTSGSQWLCRVGEQAPTQAGTSMLTMHVKNGLVQFCLHPFRLATPILPAYYHSVPFRLLMHNVTQTI